MWKCWSSACIDIFIYFLLSWDSSELQKQSCRISHAVSYFSGSAVQVSFRHLSMLLLCPITYRLPTWYLCCFTCAENSLTRIQVNMPTNLRLQILMLPVNSLYPAANSFALVCSCIYAIIIHTRVGMNLQPAIIIIFSTTYMFCLCYLIIIDAFILR